MMATFLAHAATAIFVALVSLMLIPVMVWFERKGSAFIQDRTGPNRAAVLGIRLGGLIHTIADVVKLIFKEDVTPPQISRFYYMLAPFLMMMIALMVFIAIPVADSLVVGDTILHLQGLKIDAGLLWVFAVASLGVVSIILAGWGSNNRYALLGGMRSSAQMVSYELALGIAVVGILMVYGSLDLNEIVRQQGGLLFGFLPMWGVVVQPLACILFMTAAIAECNRTPFDLPEGESEIIGFHVEYSSLKFALFFMAEYVNMVVSAALTVTLFFGGWQIPWMPTPVLESNAMTVLLLACAGMAVLSLVIALVSLRWSRRLKKLYSDRRRLEGDFWAIVFFAVAAISVVAGLFFLANPLGGIGPSIVARVAQLGVFLGKVVFFSFLFIWIRWTLPRFRYDQLMNLGWKSLLPLGLFNVAATAVVLHFLGR